MLMTSPVLAAARFVLPAIFAVFCLAFYLPLSSKAVNNIFYAGLALPALCWLLAKPSAISKLRPFAWLFIFLVLMVVMDAGSVSGLKKAVYLSLLFVCCLCLSVGGRSVHRALFVVALISAALLLYIFLDWVWIWMDTGKWVRYVKLFDVKMNPVYFSLLLTSAFIYLWLFHIEPRLEQRSCYAAIASLCVLSLLALLIASIFQSRSTLLGFAAFFFAYLLGKRSFHLGALIAVVIFLLVWLTGAGELLMHRGFSYRLVIWQDAVQRMLGECSLWFGCVNDDYLFLGKFEHPHSGYLAMFYRNGLLGAVLFLLFALVFFWRGLRARSPWVLMSLLGWGSLLTTTNGVLTSPQPLWIYFWLPIFMAVLDSQRKDVDAYQQARAG